MSIKIAASHITLKRAYEPPIATDGTRILIDRLWPRGLSKAKVAVNHWMKELAPSTELRKWFNHDPARWEEFKRRYTAELHQDTERLSPLRLLAQASVVTLVYSAHDEQHNNAVVLRELLLGR